MDVGLDGAAEVEANRRLLAATFTVAVYSLNCRDLLFLGVCVVL